MDVPGLNVDDLTVQLVPDRRIEVIGESHEEYEASACIYHRKDLSMGKPKHSFYMPHDADLGRVSTACVDRSEATTAARNGCGFQNHLGPVLLLD